MFLVLKGIMIIGLLLLGSRLVKDMLIFFFDIVVDQLKIQIGVTLAQLAQKIID